MMLAEAAYWLFVLLIFCSIGGIFYHFDRQEGQE